MSQSSRLELLAVVVEAVYCAVDIDEVCWFELLCS